VLCGKKISKKTGKAFAYIRKKWYLCKIGLWVRENTYADAFRFFNLTDNRPAKNPFVSLLFFAEYSLFSY
jgi:hypothetical protein